MESVYVSIVHYFTGSGVVSLFTLLLYVRLLAFALFSKGQQPARHNRVSVKRKSRKKPKKLPNHSQFAHGHQSHHFPEFPLKPGQTRLSVQDYTNQVASPNVTTQGSDVTDALVQTDCGSAVFLVSFCSFS